jgi:hypothetical protein
MGTGGLILKQHPANMREGRQDASKSRISHVLDIALHQWPFEVFLVNDVVGVHSPVLALMPSLGP